MLVRERKRHTVATFPRRTIHGGSDNPGIQSPGSHLAISVRRATGVVTLAVGGVLDAAAAAVERGGSVGIDGSSRVGVSAAVYDVPYKDTSVSPRVVPLYQRPTKPQRHPLRVEGVAWAAPLPDEGEEFPRLLQPSL